jgi:8-oxo-dGTP pyrophosphatase MutT (NUDIX family)
MILTEELSKYFPEDEREIEYKQKILFFLKNAANPFLRSNLEGHITGSAMLLNSDCSKFLIMHHSKLNKWLQLGGHSDGDQNLLDVAIKEAKEESGIMNIVPIIPEIFDVDVHLIPANSRDPMHFHYDIRFLLKTVDNDNFIQNHESKELRWVDLHNYQNYGLEESINRMAKKALLYNGFPPPRE